MRSKGLSSVIPALRLEGRPAELVLRGYTPGSRATFEVQTQRGHVALKLYAYDPAPEVELYLALASDGLASGSGPCVPPLLAYDRDLRLLLIGWLDGCTAGELVKDRRGARAGELAARWLERARSVHVRLGAPLGAVRMMEGVGRWVAAIAAADPALGTRATRVADVLLRTEPRDEAPCLVHGRLYPRHLLDHGDGPAVIDWENFGQGPAELDGGMFLACISRVALLQPRVAAEAARAEETFLALTAAFLGQRSLAWHRAAALLRLCCKQLPTHPRHHGSLARMLSLLIEAARLAAS